MAQQGIMFSSEALFIPSPWLLRAFRTLPVVNRAQIVFRYRDCYLYCVAYILHNKRRLFSAFFANTGDVRTCHLPPGDPLRRAFNREKFTCIDLPALIKTQLVQYNPTNVFVNRRRA